MEIYATVILMKDIIEHVILVLGIPGNILSAIVWLKRHVASKNSSAVYLAALAIIDLAYLLQLCLVVLIKDLHPSPRDALDNWFFHHVMYLVLRTTPYLELMLVLSFSIERLIAILLPLQVIYVGLSFAFSMWYALCVDLSYGCCCLLYAITVVFLNSNFKRVSEFIIT